MPRFQKAVGTLSRIQPSRTFVDGVYYSRIDITDAADHRQSFDNVFCTLKLAPVVQLKTHGTFYFWNSHCYAFRSDATLTEDIDGARKSYLKRDARLLIIMALSLVLLPYALLILIKRYARAGSRQRMQLFLES